jgi:hypothetical protein
MLWDSYRKNLRQDNSQGSGGEQSKLTGQASGMLTVP